MDKKQTYDILGVLKAAYPLFYHNANQDFMKKVTEVWHSHFGAYPYEVVERAVNLMVSKETQIPTIALLKTYIAKQQELDAAAEQKKNRWKKAGFKSEEEYQKRIAELRR